MARRTTRGRGLLEPLLARWRASVARRLLDGVERREALLDLGCGGYPAFLLGMDFARRCGVDQEAGAGAAAVELRRADLLSGAADYEDQSFDAVTMLAVLEHLTPQAGAELLRQVRRILRPGGILVLTTPTPRGDGLLRRLARVNLVSREEIAEHKGAYSGAALRTLLGEAGFAEDAIEMGRFQAGLNRWARARRR